MQTDFVAIVAVGIHSINLQLLVTRYGNVHRNQKQSTLTKNKSNTNDGTNVKISYYKPCIDLSFFIDQLFYNKLE